MDGSPSASPETETIARRRSGRVVRPPTKFASKRKRDENEAEADEDEADEEPGSDQESSDEPDAVSDADHPPPRSRKSSRSARPKKPSTKKPKINGSGHIARIPSRPKKVVRIDAGIGLFADIFGSGDAPDSIAQAWLDKYKNYDAQAMADLVNCILQCAGCDLEVTVDDIRDPENIPNRLVDLQSVHQEQQITDYPLIAKSKSTKSFRELLVSFLQQLVHLLHETDVLYKDPDLMNNLHSWLSSMSSSSLRPFRHTATTIALAVQSGLIDVAGVLDRRIATIEQQSQAAKRGKNKSKAAEIQRGLTEANGYRKTCSESIQSFFDTVFVHRYRDVDAKIRTECVEALGSWIWHLPTVFMEPGYLRYLGWMLSDMHAATRHEVLKQLLRVFKRDAQQLGHFIDRFRPRLIEMATLDVDVSVRVAAISVIDALRAAALLEPNEIDAIGKLIYDTEPRIRKAVVGFFVACLQDVHQGKLDEIGGTEALEDLDDADEDDFESPRKEWVNIKCLAESLAVYDAQIEEAQQHSGLALDLDAAAELLEAAVPDTRISLAAQVLYEKLPEVKSWELLAGYLLFDHTTSTTSKSAKSRSADSNSFKRVVAPTSEEESILLDVLSSAIRLSLAQAGEHDRNKKKGHRSEAAEANEDAALELTTVIPKLLNKFGAEPETAAIVLRMEHSLNLESFQQLRQDASKYEKLLDEISTQFSRHDDKRVLFEATSALLHARECPELEELTDSKLSLLWENVINALRNFDNTCELSIRGNLAEAPLRELSTTLIKISKLASISNCIDAFEATSRSEESQDPAIEILVKVVHRGKYEPQEDDIDDLEDEVVSFAIKACQFYFMWKTRALSQMLSAGTSIPDAELDSLSGLRQSYRRHLIETFSSRAAIDQLRLFATGSLCDLHLTFATLRRQLQAVDHSSEDAPSPADKLRVLIQKIEPGLVPELTSIFDGAEKIYAKKARKDKTLNEPAEDEDPIADDEDLDEDEEDNDAEGQSKEERYVAELRAEKALCELTAKYVLTMTAGLIDDRGSQAGKLRRRVLRNRNKLGNNFKEVVAYLDEKQPATKPGKKTVVGAAKAPAKARRPAVSEEMVAEDEDDVFEEVEPEEGSREDLRRRELLDDEPPVEDESDGGGAETPGREAVEEDVLGD
ncbi:hypothetical protein CP532_0921 [Ophiocordyceps camponoti-leonardi (nom. inval.)]|nr:hypothetical protein CP532_0921 [Ophiocordyceps camponoti-leonardi (nom. inval.)]